MIMASPYRVLQRSIGFRVGDLQDLLIFASLMVMGMYSR